MEKWLCAASGRFDGAIIDAYATPGTDLDVVSSVSGAGLLLVAIV